ncbi:type II toxin-antitoxin system VapC family toxin [Eggerthellaceae bacterium zg-1084]|uniref:Type II toxin-antitoxin system VapC family toxin n=1 Tax=Berryella wangjianweii TaxID=2734634 RepID=A0A6M8J640_9ACTN|nr:type II toxin-antitoxin system VapC family toxin [Berryella wangjianweii]NPD30785.1 type II toxin-antitoxin system VapC family toxin [Berryella wangjianweii]NPD31996.1 type II toxin-antitoxin system VapC family toxin [Eggerthellaceae bacterium zg-997]QKF07416.1 type II toxin-antitoxin system VapC family toxin [Berryella wangjianweii]
MHIVIDESVILRYLLNDDKVNSKRAYDAISSGNTQTYPESMARVAITLRDVYRVPRSVISSVLIMLLEDIHINDQKVVEHAIRMFGSSVLDFSDCLTLARNAMAGNPILSFNKPIMKRSMQPMVSSMPRTFE